MSLSMYQASVPVFNLMLNNLRAILEKAMAHCDSNKIDPAVLINYRLYPDMYPFSRQVQIAVDAAKNGVARLAGIEPPEMPNTEQTFPELITRVQKTLDFVNTIKPEQIDGSEAREVIYKHGNASVHYQGQAFLLNRALPNLYFHITTAYDILRHNGVVLGKKDFLGQH